MKRTLLFLACLLMAVISLAQATLTNYQFTNDAVGKIFNADGTEQSINSGEAMTGIYYLKVNYELTTAPETKNQSVFGNKDFYVKNDDNYSSAYGKAYSESGSYATVNEVTEITDENKTSYTSTAYTFNSTAADWLYTKDGDNYIKVKVGDVCDPKADYYASNGSGYYSNTGSTLIGWGTQTTLGTAFNSLAGIYTCSNGVYSPITSKTYDSKTTYYLVTFTDIADATSVSTDNLSEAQFVDLTEDTNTYYYKNGASFIQVNDGDVYLGDNAYYIESANPSYVLASYAELKAMGYAQSYDKKYNCSVTTDDETSTITITYHVYDSSYGTYRDYIRNAQSTIATYKTLAINTKENANENNYLSDLFAAVKLCNGIKNLVLADVANYGYSSSNKIDLYNLQGSSVKRVVLPNSTWTDASIQTCIDNRGDLPIIQAYNNNSYTTKNQEIIHCYTAGALASISDAHYNSDEIDNAYWLEINGEINSDDISFINGIDNDRLNLSGATYPTDDASKAALHNIDNDYVKYLALPELGAAPADPLYNDLYTNCANLKAVAQFVSSLGLYNAKTTEEGAIKYLTEMTATVTTASGSRNPNTAITKLKISGTLNASDVFASGSSATIDTDGHAYFYPAVDEYATLGQTRTMGAMKDADGNVVEGHTTTLSGAWDCISSVSSIDLSDASFSHIEDMTLSRMNICGAVTKEVVIPTAASVTELPADFLNYNGCQVYEIKIPSNIEKIHARAFAAADIKHVWTNGDDENIRYDNGITTDEETGNPLYGTYTFSSNLKFVGSGAFGGSTHIHDVYMLGTTAPECLVDAFSTVSYVANNSYQAESVPTKIDREAYMNSANAFMTVLHFPSNCTTNQVKLYTDVTREYSIASDELDANGKTVYYPTQCEWNRSYSQGTSGYLWNAYCNKRNPFSGTAMGFYNTYAIYNAAIEAGTASSEVMTEGYQTGKTQAQYQTNANAIYAMNDGSATFGTNKVGNVFYSTDVTTTEDDEALSYNTTLYNADYRGWHQFVLAYYTYNGTTPTVTVDFSDFSDNEWWTICEPYPLTSEELKRYFGDKVKLVKLVSVTRDVKAGAITLNFGPNLVSTLDDDEYILEAGVPYMIKPALPTDGTTLDRKLEIETSDEDNHPERFNEKTAEELQSLLTNGKYTVDAIVVNNDDVDENFKEPTVEREDGKMIHENLKYTMIGTFYKYYLPQYCYFLGWNNSTGHPAFFWKDVVADKGTRNWNPYTAIIVPYWQGLSFSEGIFENPATGQFDTIHYRYDNNGAIGETDDFVTTGGSVKVLNLNLSEAEDNDVTDINSVHTGSSVLNNGNIYNTNGQLISRNGNLNNLPKGIYIVNGKKYISK